MKIIPTLALSVALLAGAPALTWAQDSGSGDICAGVTSDVSTGAEQLAAVKAATAATVIELEGCTGSLPGQFTDALTGNEAIARVLQQENVGAGEIIGLGIDNGTVTVYVSNDDADD